MKKVLIVISCLGVGGGERSLINLLNEFDYMKYEVDLLTLNDSGLLSNQIPEKVNKIINEFITEVNKIFGERVKKIILYGSYARGDFNKNSDIDIMILTDFTDDEIVQCRSEIVQLAYNIEWNNKFNIHLSPLVKNIDRFNYWLEALPFYMNVQNEGVVLSES